MKTNRKLAQDLENPIPVTIKDETEVHPFDLGPAVSLVDLSQSALDDSKAIEQPASDKAKKKRGGRYSHIDFVPPESVANTAKKALEARKTIKRKRKGGLSNAEAKKQGVGSGVQRGVNLANRAKLSPQTVKRMKSFFARHEKNVQKARGKGLTLKTSPALMAWAIWGGNAGKSWANKVCNQMEAADRKAKEKKKKKKAELMTSMLKVAQKIGYSPLEKVASYLPDVIKINKSNLSEMSVMGYTEDSIQYNFGNKYFCLDVPDSYKKSSINSSFIKVCNDQKAYENIDGLIIKFIR